MKINAIALISALALTAAGQVPHQAAAAVTLKSEVFVEKTVKDANGQTRTELAPPTTVVPGNTVLIVIGYRNPGPAPASKFVITNPVPAAIAYRGATDNLAQVSVDGGRTYGPLATLKVRAANGTLRAATGNDVTHVRWVLPQPIPVGGTGKVSFRGAVR